MIGTLSALYGAAAAWRRAWYAGDPLRRRRLARPVVSVGNLRVGGSGKTPIVEYIARMLVEANRGAKDKTLAVIADLEPPAGSGAVVRPFRLVH